MAALTQGGASAKAIQEYHPSPRRRFAHPNGLQICKKKERRGKYAMPKNYNSNPTFAEIPVNHIHPRHHREIFQ